MTFFSAVQYFEILSGARHCQISQGGRCITDGVGHYGNNERCVVRAKETLSLSTQEFHTETNFDFLFMLDDHHKPITSSWQARSSGDRFMAKWENKHGPSGEIIEKGDRLQWFTDGSVTRKGFTVCGAPAKIPTSDFFNVIHGQRFCQISQDGKCVTDGSGRYNNNERCLIEAKKSLVLTHQEFSTEKNFDFLFMLENGQKEISHHWSSRHNKNHWLHKFDGRKGPNGEKMTAGQKLQWYSDGSVLREGFVVCAEDAPCNHNECKEWDCRDWCRCFEEEAQSTYEEQGCDEESEEECDCSLYE